ncbi:aldehyde dehydrogenase (NADP(+)) [uncultured Sulfitobacter sp.]|jgi:alpha-ketoglutaric semialdehyde dehydrogenase|uniref:aldehyde dehydrogenase (NADP(+)) n=1 Tax=uncultured Sulfitobacter sp. TaxID=191468 RepID=UPI0030DA1509|tara:strand:- start:29786 stop:31291 length:1506 start_codon:yes stop_codon:yes gene_type:complete
MELIGKHLIAGEWVGSADQFSSDPAQGPAHDFAAGTVDLVDRAARAAEDAFLSYSATTSKERAAFLNAIADEIDARIDALAEIGSQETGLPDARLRGETGRTSGQLRMFAAHILDGAYLDARHDAALPDRAPLPRSDLRMIQRPIGPVAVFGASNFPLAFSTAGGDTASALAAGCPVVVRGHHAHPGTAEIVAVAINAAITSCGIDAGVFSLIQGGGLEVGQALVQHPLIKAVGFTGSLRGGRALFDLCAQRPEPIPFFGELGSINPVFLLPTAVAARGADIGKGWAASLMMGAGQFCTNPGVVVVLDGPSADTFRDAAVEALQQGPAQTTLTTGIADAYFDGRDRVSATKGTTTLVTSKRTDKRSVTPSVFETTGAQWLASDALAHEVFGPLGIIVRVADMDEMRAVARDLEGQLTCTLQLDADDTDAAKSLMPILERKAGRILANGYPTGVEVSSAMVHGGPYPASTNFGATSVGTMAIRRFLRPVCYQDLPAALLPTV